MYWLFKSVYLTKMKEGCSTYTYSSVIIADRKNYEQLAKRAHCTSTHTVATYVYLIMHVIQDGCTQACVPITYHKIIHYGYFDLRGHFSPIYNTPCTYLDQLIWIRIYRFRSTSCVNTGQPVSRHNIKWKNMDTAMATVCILAMNLT